MFDWIRARRQRNDQVHAAYHKIVEAARAPQIFTKWGVADSFDGRFDSVALHTFLVLRRVRAEGPDWVRFGQALFDLMFKDFDQVLRELGVGDMGVGKRVKKMAEAFLGRVKAYEEALAHADRRSLMDAVQRNLFRDAEVEPEILETVAAYINEANNHLSDLSIHDIASGQFGFRKDAIENAA